MGRPILTYFVDKELTKSNDTFIYNIGRIIEDAKDKTSIRVVLKNVGTHTAYNVRCTVFNEGFEDIKPIEPFDLKAGQSKTLKFEIIPNDNFVDGNKFEVRLDYDNC